MPNVDPIERFFRSGLKLPHLRILVALADLGQVTRVANAFHVTQPAISKQIAEIEEAIGVAVVTRSGNKLELTAIGKVIVACGRDVLRHLELARRDVSALAAGTGGHVRVGAVVTVPDPLVANAVELFLRRAPAASFSFVEATLDRLLKMLEDGDLDVAVGRNRITSTLVPVKHETLLRDPFVFVAGAAHPLGAPDRQPGWADLRECRWITPQRGSPAYTTLIATLDAQGIVPAASSVESSSLALNLALLQRGDFVSILPVSIARSHAIRANMRVLPLPAIERLGEVIAHSRADVSGPATELFVQCLVEASSELQDD
ncbi:LysR family transcriptional regulator [Paraburkholderia silvatlantica]|uniref:LysR family transcriptional regulator n=1 Tax=Paraburkholderia silvatlantica TaxID=321895 RepID=A0A2V4TLG2_9BURK|nr:LysR family transcriptional regulator [Paraburkholderia silvatlantica]PYE16205.1 LysR family transcriptional regulator [Paraburkholderia silvatlantica]